MEEMKLLKGGKSKGKEEGSGKIYLKAKLRQHIARD